MDPTPVHATGAAYADRDVLRRIQAAATAAARAAGQVQLTYFGRSQTVCAIRRHDLKLVVDRQGLGSSCRQSLLAFSAKVELKRTVDSANPFVVQ
jgi:hypothetical protein